MMMDPCKKDLAAIALRLRALRDDEGISVAEMAAACEMSSDAYEVLESGTADFSFTTLYHAANKLGIDMIDLLTGDSPNLSGYSVIRAGRGLSIRRYAGFEYQHLAPTFKNKLAEPFLVTAPFVPDSTHAGESDHNSGIALASHEGQELNYILSGHLRFAYRDSFGLRYEDLGPGDTLLYDSSHEHGMKAIADPRLSAAEAEAAAEPCVFLAIVLKGSDDASA
ncbi:MAG: helix-turn-helix domain-containing protein [Coriobacteriia bacterium]|nr:helix-turn-helix domain-containing protein [Coriobacteriia bacterium]MCL2537137.1 helix-turn-helix domain-containing protein [Coriobacteriia bacterium]